MTNPNFSIPPVGLKKLPISDATEGSKIVVHANITSSAGKAALLAELAPQHGVRAVVITDPDKAATVYEAQAQRQNSDRRIGHNVNPVDFANTARKVVKRGGALVEFSYPQGGDLSSLYRAVEATQNAEAPTQQAGV